MAFQHLSLASCALVTAVITPFTPGGKAIDAPALTRLCAYLIDTQASDALLVCGTTGESPTLDADEKTQIVQTARQVTQTHQKQLWVGVGSNNTARSILEAQHMAALGADVLLALTPYYNKPSQAGLLAHFKAIAQAVPDTPVVLYNIPGRSGTEIAPETMVALREACSNIVGVKQSVASLDTASEVLRVLPPESGFYLWSGDDSLTLPMMSVGGVGVVSVLSHLAGASIKAMMNALMQGDLKQAQTLHAALLPLARECFFLPNPTVVKSALAKLGHCDAALRLPLVEPNAAEAKRIEALCQAVQALR
ncbi:MAG: 4-hydroxy-tetrahydrodipicolinate synthase [Vampirovibrionales bacterium]|nr:4-hydroxy-tetrahydrodipicolinate synthase [Vampirovibrionales bacterium]